MTFIFFQKPEGAWAWWLLSRLGTVKAHCPGEFTSKQHCLQDIRRISKAMSCAAIQEGIYQGDR